MKKLSERLLDAAMQGDNSTVEDIKSEVESRRPISKSDNYRFSTLLHDPHSSAIKIYDFLEERVDPDWWEWEPATLERILHVKYGVNLSAISHDKLMAIRFACRSDSPFHDWYDFQQCSLSFSGSMADFEYMKKPSPGMIINCVKTLIHIRPDREKFFSNDVMRYICVMLIDDGIYCPPLTISEVISGTFAKMVSEEMKKRWPEIIAKYKHVLATPGWEPAENVVDVQAKRLVNADASALTYGR